VLVQKLADLLLELRARCHCHHRSAKAQAQGVFSNDYTGDWQVLPLQQILEIVVVEHVELREA
jgi:hypothetical protein